MNISVKVLSKYLQWDSIWCQVSFSHYVYEKLKIFKDAAATKELEHLQ